MHFRVRAAWFMVIIGSAACGGSGGTGAAEGVGPGGATVGGACRTSADCASVCSTGGDFPGMCTVSCRSDVDCPGGTSCVDDHGGICALPCRVPADCAGLGVPFTCKAKDRVGASGETLVCRKD